jgi:uncharacterized membrane protein
MASIKMASIKMANLKQENLFHLAVLSSLTALVLLCILWESVLAPLRPGGSWLVIKALPLALALPGIWRRNVYTLQWASMLVLLYMAEGIVRGMSDQGLSASLGWIEAGLSLFFFVCTLLYLRPYKRAARALAGEAIRKAARQTHE